MAFVVMEDLTIDAVRAHSASGRSVTVTLGATSLTMSIAEAVDLIDAVATVLGTLPDADGVSPTHPIPYTVVNSATVAESNTVGRSSRDLARDEDRVRAAAEVRESL